MLCCHLGRDHPFQLFDQENETPSQENLKVAIIEDVRSLRDGLRMLIDGTDGFSCVGSFRTMEEALEKIEAHPPDVVLADIGLPGMSGIDGVRLMKDRNPSLTVLMLTVYEDNERILRTTLCAGACGYLVKKTPPARLLDSIREATNGGSPMSLNRRRVVNLFREIQPPERADYTLTQPHELRLLKLMVEGHSYKTAATELGVSLNTVCFHIKQIYEKDASSFQI